MLQVRKVPEAISTRSTCRQGPIQIPKSYLHICIFAASEKLGILKVVIGELRDFLLIEILEKLRCA